MIQVSVTFREADIIRIALAEKALRHPKFEEDLRMIAYKFGHPEIFGSHSLFDTIIEAMRIEPVAKRTRVIRKVV